MYKTLTFILLKLFAPLLCRVMMRRDYRLQIQLVLCFLLHSRWTLPRPSLILDGRTLVHLPLTHTIPRARPQFVLLTCPPTGDLNANSWHCQRVLDVFQGQV